jgi:hypothetical protein
MTFTRSPLNPKRFLSHTRTTAGSGEPTVTDLIITVGAETVTLPEEDARAYLAYLQEKFA